MINQFTIHLFSATSISLIVAIALGGLWALSGQLAPSTLEASLLQSAVTVLGLILSVMYVFYSVALIAAARRTQGTVPAPQADEPPPRKRVMCNHWRSVGTHVGMLLLLFAIGQVVGFPASNPDADVATYHVFRGLEWGTLFLGATGFVFSLALLTTHSLRGILRSFTWTVYGDRPLELRRNLPLDVALVAVPLFFAVLFI